MVKAKNNNISVIIAGGGSSTRFGQAKQFALLDNKPLLSYSLEKFSLIENVIEIIIVTSDLQKTNELIDKTHCPKNIPIKTVLGGQLRQDSVYNGFCKVNPSAGFVLIHDVARPLFNTNDVKKCVEKALMTGASVLAVPSVDTLRRANDCNGDLIVESTINREMLYLIQTPQVISYAFLDLAYKEYRDQPAWQSFTDEAGMIELLGKPVSLVVGNSKNIKITYPEDLEIANGILKKTEKNIYV